MQLLHVVNSVEIRLSIRTTGHAEGCLTPYSNVSGFNARIINDLNHLG